MVLFGFIGNSLLQYLAKSPMVQWEDMMSRGASASQGKVWRRRPQVHLLKQNNSADCGLVVIEIFFRERRCTTVLYKALSGLRPVCLLD